MHILGFVWTLRGRSLLARNSAGWARITLVHTATAAESALRNTCVDALLLELNPTGDVSEHEAFVRRVREAFHSLPIILYAPLTRAAAKQIMRLANAGADELLLEEQEDERWALQRLIIRAHVSRCAARTIDVIADRLPPPTRAILLQSIHLAVKPLTVAGLARAVGVNRKTLVNRLGAAGLPGPETIISWCRLLLACELLEDPGRSVEQVALLLGFSSGVALRNMSRRHLGMTPSALREGGALERVAHRLFTPSRGVGRFPIRRSTLLIR